MKQPLVLFLYERLLPGGQLVNRLQDRGYRVQPLSEPTTLVDHAEREKPLLVIADLEPRSAEVCAAIQALRNHEPTSHIPVIALVARGNQARQASAREAGATLAVDDHAILTHFEQFLEQALQVD